MNRIYIGILIMSLLIPGCASFEQTQYNWEGITDNQLKVTVYEFFLFDDNSGEEKNSVQVRGRVQQRASLLLACFASINLPRDKVTPEVDRIMNILIEKTISEGKFTGYQCNENHYCTASGLYNISEIRKTLGEIAAR